MVSLEEAAAFFPDLVTLGSGKSDDSSVLAGGAARASGVISWVGTEAVDALFFVAAWSIVGVFTAVFAFGRSIAVISGVEVPTVVALWYAFCLSNHPRDGGSKDCESAFGGF